MGDIASLSPLRDVLASYGLAADKRLGQHFLLDLNVTDKIARLVPDIEKLNLIEIGPGPGGLTRSVLAMGAKSVTAVEKDERFLPVLQDIADQSDGRLSFHNEDALKVDETKLVSSPSGIVSNLPYNVGTALFIKWLMAEPCWWQVAVLMFQKEVAERVVARPGDSAYGRLAVLTDCVADAHLAYHIPARAFTPPPKVDSAVVVVTPKAQRFAHIDTLEKISSAAFGQRRKMLRKSLKSLTGQWGLDLESWLAASDIKPTQRPEEVTPEQFQSLATDAAQAS